MNGTEKRLKANSNITNRIDHKQHFLLIYDIQMATTKDEKIEWYFVTLLHKHIYKQENNLIYSNTSNTEKYFSKHMI